MRAAQVQPDIKRQHTYETTLATLYLIRKGRCDHCRKDIEHYLCATIWTAADGSDSLLHDSHGHSCVREMMAAAIDRRRAARKAQRAGR